MTSEHFTELVRPEQEPLRRFLLALCSGDSKMADNIAQEALVRAYLNSRSFLGLSSFKTWLFRIAYNCYVDNLRRQKHRPVIADLESASAVFSEDQADASFKYQQLYMALNRLSEKEKAVIVLHYFEDRSTAEISAILREPVRTVKYHLHRGRQSLKKYLSL